MCLHGKVPCRKAVYNRHTALLMEPATFHTALSRDLREPKGANRNHITTILVVFSFRRGVRILDSDAVQQPGTFRTVAPTWVQWRASTKRQQSKKGLGNTQKGSPPV